MRRGPASPDDRRHGVTLLEILIAMLVLSIGAASVLALFAAGTSTQKRALDRTHAALVAERVVSEVQARYTTAKTAEALTAELRRDLPETFGDYAWEVFLVRPGAASRGSSDSKDGGAVDWQPQELVARVLVRWKQSGNARAEAFHAVLLPKNPQGGEEPAPSGTGRGPTRGVRTRKG